MVVSACFYSTLIPASTFIFHSLIVVVSEIGEEKNQSKLYLLASYGKYEKQYYFY